MKNLILLKTALLLVVLTLISSCDKSKDEPSQPKPSKEFYIQATIDNKSTILETDNTGANGMGMGTGYNSSGNGEGEEYMTQFGGIYNITETNEIEIRLVTKVMQRTEENSDVWKATMYSLFKPQTYIYGRDSQDGDTIDEESYKNGIVISYIDNDGEEWRSDYGSADQTGSIFKITSVVKNTDPTTYPTMRQVITGEFSCKLYNKAGKSKNLEDGKFNIRILYHSDFRIDE
ncbi:hypothetical protein [Xanthocytophaga flava]|uniref:hypothetical protein n=1 Tax=Xanthocytophaga flava TaxID=3048013 RepID=UPI0028D36102|nr:hypothetical protein [Xanthocytophaga flavus]MDJ1470012.1 hypothetical protein [Xanthocytophaga flavus]